MDDHVRVYGAVAGTVSLFVLIQIGALALVEPFVAAEARPVEDPTDPRNSVLFFGAILLATGTMLAALRYGRQWVIRAFIVLVSGFLGWFVVGAFSASLATASTGIGALDTVLWAVSEGGPVVAGLGIVAGLVYHPEWYVIDAAGVVMGAGAAGLFGISFGPFPAIVFLIVLAVYDAISVYGTEHMLTLADGVIDMKVPVLLVVPTTLSYSFVAEGASRDADETTVGDESGENDTTAKSVADQDEESPHERTDGEMRDAIYIGLGDAVMPSILVASAAVFLPDVAPIAVPWITMNLPALTTMIGTIVGLLALLWLVLRGRAHAGLPLLNGGAILGYLVGTIAGGLTLAEAIGLPL